MLMEMLMLTGSTVSALNGADVLFLVDESGSMSGEHAWLKDMVFDLEAGLQAKDMTDNQYGLIGFGDYSYIYEEPHKHTVGGGDWGTAADLSTATSSLTVSGAFEDGWAAIDFAFNNYTFREGAALNIVLITDEDRDYYPSPYPYSNLTYDSVLSTFQAEDALLNVVVNAELQDENNQTALGIDSEGNAYTADGSGDYNTSTGGVAVSGFGTTIDDYVDLALDTGGAVWDLNQLRTGGLTATSFTKAFVDIKVEEIQQQVNVVPEPSTLLLLGSGLVGAFVLGRKKISRR
jgi:hypothetical protein